MKSYRKEIRLTYPRRRGYLNITPQVEEILHESGIREGLVLVNAMHISASVFINDDESGLLADFETWLAGARARHALYDPAIVTRMARLYGTDTDALLDGGLGDNLGGLFEAELAYLRDREWATSADDVLWRRTKLGLTLPPDAQNRVRAFFDEFLRHRFAQALTRSNDQCHFIL